MMNGEWVGLAVRPSFSRYRSCNVQRSPFTLAIVLLMGCGGRGQVAPANPPRIVFEKPVHNSGVVDQGAPLVYDFAFTNRGGLDLGVDKLRSGCGCAATVGTGRFIPPGATGRVSVQCDTVNAIGRQRRTVSVYTNDPVRPVTVVRLVAVVQADVTITPSPFYVGRVHRGERVRRDGSVRWQAHPPGVVVADRGADFQVETAAPIDAGDRTAFSLVVNADAPIGPLDGRLLVRGVDARLLRTVPVIGEVVPDVSVSPARVVLELPVGAAQVPTGSVLVHNAGPGAVRITGAEWPDGAVAVAALAAGTRYRLTLKLDAPRGDAPSELLVHTDHREQPLLRVPVVLSSADTRASAAP
jgi:hypothetical protein